MPKLKQDMRAILTTNWKIWIPFQFLNFNFVPQQLQVCQQCLNWLAPVVLILVHSDHMQQACEASQPQNSDAVISPDEDFACWLDSSHNITGSGVELSLSSAEHTLPLLQVLASNVMALVSCSLRPHYLMAENIPKPDPACSCVRESDHALTD